MANNPNDQRPQQQQGGSNDKRQQNQQMPQDKDRLRDKPEDRNNLKS